MRIASGLLLLVVGLSLNSCDKIAPIQLQKARSLCVAEATFAAWTWRVKKGDPVRIVVVKVRPGVDHSQAQALVNKKWTYLVTGWDSSGLFVSIGEPSFNSIPYRVATLREWTSEQVPE